MLISWIACIYLRPTASINQPPPIDFVVCLQTPWWPCHQADRSPPTAPHPTQADGPWFLASVNYFKAPSFPWALDGTHMSCTRVPCKGPMWTCLSLRSCDWFWVLDWRWMRIDLIQWTFEHGLLLLQSSLWKLRRWMHSLLQFQLLCVAHVHFLSGHSVVFPNAITVNFGSHRFASTGFCVYLWRAVSMAIFCLCATTVVSATMCCLLRNCLLQHVSFLQLLSVCSNVLSLCRNCYLFVATVVCLQPPFLFPPLCHLFISLYF